MKKTIIKTVSLFLSLLFVIGIIPSTVRAAVNPADYFSYHITKDEQNVAVYIYAEPEKVFFGCIIWIEYDPTVLSPLDQASGTTEATKGWLYEAHGKVEDENLYAVSLTHAKEICFASKTAFLCAQFKIIDTSKNANIDAVYCNQLLINESTLIGGNHAMLPLKDCGHMYSSAWTIDKAATCTTDGSKSHHCACGAKSGVTSIPKLGHKYSWKITEAPSATVAGSTKGVCTHCGNTITKTVPAKKYSDGWHTFYGDKFYYKNGDPLKGMQTIEGKKYIFNKSTCAMCKGKVSYGGKYYILDSETGAMRYGKVSYGGKYYIMNTTTGAMCFGKVKYQGNNYIANTKSGYLYFNRRLTCGGKEYFVDRQGIASELKKWTPNDIDDLALNIDWAKQQMEKAESTAEQGDEISQKAYDKIAQNYALGAKSWLESALDMCERRCTCPDSGDTTLLEDCKKALNSLYVVENTKIDDGYNWRSHSDFLVSLYQASADVLMLSTGFSRIQLEILQYQTTYYTPYNLETPDFKLVNVVSGVKVSWQPISGATGYIVYRKAGSATTWTKVATLKGNGKTSYVDTKRSNGVTYTYTVKAYHGNNYSAITSKKIIFLTAPTKATVSSGKTGITVKWGKNAKASGYYVYRKAGSGSWTKIATVQGAAKVTYLDKSAKKGTTYAYRVVAYKGTSRSSYYTSASIKDKY